MTSGALHSQRHHWLGSLSLLACLSLSTPGNAQTCPATSLAQLGCHRAAGVVAAHEVRIKMDPRADAQARNGAEVGRPIAQQFDIQWRNLPGPAWVENVPDGVIATARSYRHRGLPLVDLWQSSHYMVALGLSNHGVPGVYFTQKLP
jgi:hypothetical protein